MGETLITLHVSRRGHHRCHTVEFAQNLTIRPDRPHFECQHVPHRNREAHRFTLSNGYKDLRYMASMANTATVTATIATAAKNSFASTVAQGGAGPEDYVSHLTDFVARANGVR